MSSEPRPPQHPLFLDWVNFFNEGREFGVDIDKERLAKKLGVNTAVLIGMALTIAVILGFVALLLFTDIGRVVTYVLLGLFFVAMVFAFFHLLGLRRKLRAATTSDTYFRLSKQGIVVAETLEIPWELTTGVAVSDARGQRAFGLMQKLAHRFALAAGAEQVLMCIGFNADVTKQLRNAAHPLLRRQLATTFEFGMLRLALDTVVPAEELTRSIFAIPAAARAAGRDVVITDNRQQFNTALIRMSNGKSPFEDLFKFLDAAAEDIRQQPEPKDEGVVEDQGAEHNLLERSVLPPEGIVRLQDARNVLAGQGPEALFQRYPAFDNGFGDTPTEGMLITEIGQEFDTVIWLDWKGDDA
ncbi:MAG TPA: hypothetical protein H9830_04895, partial [Candidatus Agrococcus pullicola]|nr:hypothetical protein [Candidatus Agrococcus pullicola]